MRWMTAGESHGPALVAILDGLPAGVKLATDDVRRELARRRGGYGRGARMTFEADEVEIVGGLRHGVTTGAPFAVRIANSEWGKWETVMAADPVSLDALQVDAGQGDAREAARNRPITRPRPGHADLAGMTKYGHSDARDVLERASARETAARVAVGAAAKAYLSQVAGTVLLGHVCAIGGARSSVRPPTTEDARRAVDAGPVRCAEPNAGAAMVAEIDRAKRDGETLGGSIEVIAHAVPAGLGSYAQWDRRLDARLAAAMMSIPSVKAVEIGDGLEVAAARGTQAHDELRRHRAGLGRVTNRAGGIEGGVSNGSDVIVRAHLKPISTVPRALASVDLATGEEERAAHQRSDVCAVVPAAVIGEAMVALVLAEALTEKCGGDSIVETRRNLQGYLDAIPSLMRVDGEEGR